MIRSLLPDYSKDQWLCFTFATVVNFLSWSVATLQGPFFPREAENHHLSATEYGAVTAMFDVSVVLLGPLWGKILSGNRIFLAAKVSTLVISTSCVLFGFVHLIQGKAAFIIICSLLRIPEGVGKSLFFVSSRILVTQYFEEPDGVLSTVETCCGLGMITGPILGGAIFDVTGFMGPFLSIGLVMTVIGCFGWVFMRPTDLMNTPTSNLEHKDPVLSVLKSCVACCSLYSVFLTGFIWNFLFIGLEPHVRVFHISATQIGLIFMLGSLTYTMQPLWGHFSSRVGYIVPFVTSALIQAVGCSMIGPLPMFSSTPNLSLVYIGFAVFCFGSGGQFLVSMLMALREVNSPTSYLGLRLCLYSLGNILGSVLGGIFLDSVGFANSTFIFVVLTLILVIPVCIIAIKQKRRRLKKESLNSDYQ